MSKVLNFSPRVKTDYDKVREVLGNESFVTLWVDENGTLGYMLGQELTLEQQSLLNTLMGALTMDKFKDEINYQAEEE